MKNNRSISIGSRTSSVAYALNGLKLLVTTEVNARIHLAMTVLVLVAGWVLDISKGDWIAITFAIALVWIAEGFNTCIEHLCDLYCDNQYNKAVGVIKDISAGAVLIASITSIIIGAIVFFF